jgi:hypothetical protein
VKTQLARPLTCHPEIFWDQVEGRASLIFDLDLNLSRPKIRYVEEAIADFFGQEILREL